MSKQNLDPAQWRAANEDMALTLEAFARMFREGRFLQSSKTQRPERMYARDDRGMPIRKMIGMHYALTAGKLPTPGETVSGEAPAVFQLALEVRGYIPTELPERTIGEDGELVGLAAGSLGEG